MKRKAVFLVASASELLRFALLAFVAFDAGIMAGGAAGDVFRYAASAQLLFAIGFFFLWLDRPRYGRFAPLLVAGKAMNVSLAAISSLEGLLSRKPTMMSGGDGPLGAIPALVVVAADLFGLAVLLASRPPREGSGPGPADIEKVEA